jgi:ABC-type proline/glycine betaine transport system substrate-binding protein
MKHIIKTTLATAFAASLLAGTAMAQSSTGNQPGNDKGPSLEEKQQMLDQESTGSIGGNYMSQDDVGGWSDGKINVVVVSTLDSEDPNRAALEDRMKTNPDDVAALQSAIQNNDALRAQLESQNVQLNNVVAAEKAADGSVTFYVR